MAASEPHRKAYRRDWSQYPEKLHPFIHHGVEFSETSDEQWHGTAPFSTKPDKFYVNPENGLWDDKVTGDSGNIYKFLEKMVEHYREEITPKVRENFAKDLELPTEALDDWPLGFDGNSICMPVVSGKGTVRDIRRRSFKTRKWMSTKGCKAYLGNAEQLAGKVRQRVWLTEGESDAIALRYLLRQVDREADVVCWVPGANVFKKEWVPLIAKHEVIVAFDKDDAGRKVPHACGDCLPIRDRRPAT